MGYQEACIEVIIDHIIQKEGWKDVAISLLISEIVDKNWVKMFIISDLYTDIVSVYHIQSQNALERKIYLF